MAAVFDIDIDDGMNAKMNNAEDDDEQDMIEVSNIPMAYFGFTVSRDESTDSSSYHSLTLVTTTRKSSLDWIA